MTKTVEEREMEKKVGGEKHNPDGGWGWMVVLGAALINLVNQSMFANFGLIFGEHLKDLAHGHATGITLVMALSVVVTNFSGLLVGPLLKRVSIRFVNFAGIFLTGTGLIVCSFSSEIWHICIGYGLLTGMGLGLLASGTFLAINDFFTTKKSTAVGLAMAGTSVGQMTMPTLIGMLLKKYDFSGTTLILGFMSYTGVVGAMFFKPILCCKKWAVSRTDEEDGEPGPIKNANAPKHGEETTLLNGERSEKKHGIIKETQEAHYENSTVELANSQPIEGDQTETCMTKVVHSLGLPLLKDPTYVHILIGLGFAYVSSVSFGAFFPMFLQDEVSFTLMETTSCMTALSFSDVMGRLTVPEISRRLNLGNRSSFMLGCILLAICRSYLVEMTEFSYVLTVSFFVGYFRSVTVINQNLVISEYIEKDKLPSAVGLNMVTKAILTLTFGQYLGFLKDMFSYAICIHLLNVIVIIVVVAYLLEMKIKKVIKKKRKKQPADARCEEQL